jgi:hypothetical protein
VLDPTVFDQFVVISSVDVGDSSPVPVEEGGSIRAATGAVSLGPMRTDRTHFGQFVGNNGALKELTSVKAEVLGRPDLDQHVGGEDAATKRLPSVDADGPHGTIDRVDLRPKA